MRDKSEIEQCLDWGLHLSSRRLILTGEVDEDLADQAIKCLHILDTMSQQPIEIILNSEGGDNYHGMAIYDAIKRCRSHVTVVGTGYVMSMGSVIIQAADKRVMTPYAKMMIHYGEWGMDDHPKIAKKWVEEEDRFSRDMEDIYLDKIKELHPRFTRARLQKMLNFDTILSSNEALELGLIDGIG